MIVKFFKKRGKGKASSCKACVDYLLNKPNNTAQILQGDARLSQKIADNLDFNNTYTAGCLSFEEPNIPEEAKRDIMARFEKTIFAGLSPEQYNISWIQHTDKGRLELNFVIPNVELTSQKRLQPYYDKADRPLVENFKQIINYEYNLSDPNDPSKQQVMITKQELPKDKKNALQAITDGLTALATAGHINDRQDVINALERAGFEIARITSKNLSIKTDGQNLRLKGAFYEQDFRFSNHLSTSIEERTRNYKRDSQKRYQTAREKFDRAIRTRQQEFSRKYPNRAEEIDKKYCEYVQNSNSDRRSDINNTRHSNKYFDNESPKSLPRNDNLEKFCPDSPETLRRYEILQLPNRQREETLHRNRQALPRSILGQQWDVSDTKNLQQGGKINGNRNRNTFRESLERLIRTARERAERFTQRIRELTQRKRADQETIQRNYQSILRNKQTILKNQYTVRNLDEFNHSIRQVIERKRAEKLVTVKNRKRRIFSIL